MDANQIIDGLGGTSQVAGLMGVKPPSVTAWRTEGIPEDKLIRLAPLLEQKGIATRKDLRPDDWHLIWPEIKNKTKRRVQKSAD